MERESDLASRRQRTLLLVEDSQELAQLLVRELTTLGYRVVHAADGITAIDLHASEQPDLVLLDWMLPDLDGLEVLRRLRQHAATPVLMLTARSEETDLIVGLELGADDYVTKPFSTRELATRVHVLLRRVDQLQHLRSADRSPTEMVLRYQGLCLDPQAHRATHDGQRLELTPIEFALLALLVRNPGRAFSRTYLLETVWGHAATGSHRSVDNTMLRLRKKLGALGDALETVWGVGYRLQPVPAP